MYSKATPHIRLFTRLTAFLLLSAVLLFLSACSEPVPEDVDIATALTLDDSFKGTRMVTLTFPNSVVAPGTESETNLDKVVQKYCPDALNYAKNTTNGKIAYSFSLDFTSIYDYTEKTTAIAGTQTVVNFSNPDTVMTQGWKLEENFRSAQLINWIHSGADAEGFEGMDFNVTETSTSVSLNNDEQVSAPQIAVNCLTGYPVQKIEIFTTNKKTVFDRTIMFTISQSTSDQIGSKLTEYFKNITDASAAFAQWQIENNSYIYTVKFNDISLRELAGYTNKLLCSVYCEVSYEDKSTGSTPLAEQNSYTETLDFSNYIGNSSMPVPVEYTYSVKDADDLGECRIYEGDDWIAATDLLSTNKYGKLCAVKSENSLLMLRINDGTQYSAASIDITATPLSEDKIKKSVTFKYDIATGGNEASDYAASYFRSINIGAVQSVEDGKSTCTVTFSGTPSEVSTAMASVFGNGNSLTSSSYTPLLTLRTTKDFTDHINFSSLITGENVYTPLYYRITTESGDILKSFVYTPAVTDTDAADQPTVTKNDDGSAYILMPSAEAAISFSVSSPNISDIIFCSVLGAIVIVLGIISVIIARGKKEYQTALPHNDRQPLPKSNTEMVRVDTSKTKSDKRTPSKKPPVPGKKH